MRLHDLLTGIHDERPIADDWLADREAAEDKYVEGRGVTGLGLGRLDHQMVARAEDSELVLGNGAAVAPDKPCPVRT